MPAPQTTLLPNLTRHFDTKLVTDMIARLFERPRELSPKYFYDERGSRLFERICDLPEYYQTRTEMEIIQATCHSMIEQVGTGTVVELGAGSAAKSRLFLQAAFRAGREVTYAPVDISHVMLKETADELRILFPWVSVDPIVADFTRDISIQPDSSARLILFLGGTIGNFDESQGAQLLGRVAASMNASDRFVLGVDLVKDPNVLHAAYNDSAGVTAEFNLNILRVLNREAGAKFRLDRFRHYAYYDPSKEQIEMHLASLDRQTVLIEAVDRAIELDRGETIRTEISRKFSRAGVERLLSLAGMALEEFHTDRREYFALCVARCAGGDN